MSDRGSRGSLLDSRDNYNRFTYVIMRITGASLPNGTATNAALAIGRDFAVARDNGSNAVTITFNEPLPIAPVIFAQTTTADSHIEVTTADTTHIVYSSYKSSDHSSLADVDVDLRIELPQGLSVR